MVLKQELSLKIIKENRILDDPSQIIYLQPFLRYQHLRLRKVEVQLYNDVNIINYFQLKIGIHAFIGA